MNTMFAFGGIYAAGTFGMSFEEIIQFGIALNVTAGLGAAGFAWLDDRIGSKRTVQIGIVGLIVFGVPDAGGREQDRVPGCSRCRSGSSWGRSRRRAGR